MPIIAVYLYGLSRPFCKLHSTHWHCKWKAAGQRSQHSRSPPSLHESQQSWFTDFPCRRYSFATLLALFTGISLTGGATSFWISWKRIEIFSQTSMETRKWTLHSPESRNPTWRGATMHFTNLHQTAWCIQIVFHGRHLGSYFRTIVILLVWSIKTLARKSQTKRLGAFVETHFYEENGPSTISDSSFKLFLSLTKRWSTANVRHSRDMMCPPPLYKSCEWLVSFYSRKG